MRNKPTSYKDITTYNNYYEFGTVKSDPHRRAKNFLQQLLGDIAIEGEVEKPIEIINGRNSEILNLRKELSN